MGKTNCFLSKCRYLNGVKCLKLAWFEANAPQEIPRPDSQTQAVFSWGHFIGDKAKQFFPDGEENLEQDFGKHLSVSREWLQRRIPLFEVAYMTGNNLYARPDILRPCANNAWDIIEVKCNTAIHEVNIRDIAYQRFVLEAAGLDIHRLFLMHPRGNIKVNGDTSPADIFELEDVTDRSNVYLPGIACNVERIRTACALDAVPEIPCGEQCEKPYRCPRFEICLLESIPVDYSLVGEPHDIITKMAESDDVASLLRIAENCVEHDADNLFAECLHKAMACAKYSSDFCEIATLCRKHRLKLHVEAEDCLQRATTLARLPADFCEIEVVRNAERQI